MGQTGISRIQGFGTRLYVQHLRKGLWDRKVSVGHTGLGRDKL